MIPGELRFGGASTVQGLFLDLVGTGTQCCPSVFQKRLWQGPCTYLQYQEDASGLVLPFYSDRNILFKSPVCPGLGKLDLWLESCL